MNENKEKTAGNLANSVVEGYDYSVAVRMSGRAGAYSPTGGKGNAFEVMYSDKKNLSNLLKPDTTTTLTNSSTARQVDLVTKKGNRIIERIQCKDTPSAKGTMDTIKRVQNGQYRTTQLVGTSESAAAFNAKAPSQGVTKVMKDSGISTKDTTRVSNKFNGVQSSTGIANAAKSSAKLGGAFGGGMAAVESIVNGDDLSTTTGNVASGALKGSVSGAAETWQPDRPKKERECNIEQGKIAEEITEQFIRQYYSQELSLKTYDEIRNDDFKKHAPFDFLLWKTGTVNIAFIEEAIRQDIARTPNKFVKLSNVTRRLCRTLGVKIVEVKSTNIRNDLKVESDFTGDYDNVKSVQKLLETIRRKDDVFCYPKLKRRESDPGYCLDDYCREVQERFSEFDGCKGENLRRRVIAWECENQCCDIFVRVYLDRPAKKGFVIGWMQKEELLDDTVQFKRMRQKNKSELALYFAKNLGETKGIDCLAQAFGKPKQRVYANPYTPTNFYHKTDDCKFIRRVPKEELLIFDSEEAAIQNGRFINRCRECFSKDG